MVLHCTLLLARHIRHDTHANSQFPIGSLTLLTNALATAFDSLFFKVVGTMMTVSVLALWTVVALPTLRGFIRGTLFVAPCLDNLPKPPSEPAHAEEKSKRASTSV